MDLNDRLAGLAAFCQEHPIDEKVLVAPSHITGRLVTEALARHDPAEYIERLGLTPAGYYVTQHAQAYRRETTGLPPRWDELAGQERKQQEEEYDRQRYVAATRARNLLVVSTYPDKADPEDGFWNPLLAHLESVPELGMPSARPGGSRDAPAAHGSPRDDPAATRRRIQRRKDLVCSPTYRIETVTKIAHGQTRDAVARDPSGRGMSWGRVIHRLLEIAVTGDMSHAQPLAANLLRQEGRSADEAAEAIRTVNGVVQSPLWQRMLRSARQFTEVPFTVQTTAKALGLGEGPDPVVLAGVIDLLFREPDGWVLVDYKTDELPEGPAPLVRLYAPQIRIYRHHWETLSGEEVKEAGIYFIRAEAFVPV